VSPTEDQLRAALQDGVGAALDPDAVIGRAEAYRRHRRVRVLVTSATAVVVAAAGIGIGFGVSSTTPRRTTAAGSQASAATALGTAGANLPPANHAAPAISIPCPTTRPALSTAGTTSGSLFTSDVAAVTVCGYRYNGSQIPVTQTYAGADARAIVISLEQASRARPVLHCDVVVPSRLYWLTFLAQYTNGARAQPVIAGVGCNGSVNNGRTLRYEWSPPAVLASLLAKMNDAVPLPAAS